MSETMEVDKTSKVTRRVHKENKIEGFIAAKSCLSDTFCAFKFPVCILDSESYLQEKQVWGLHVQPPKLEL